MPFKLDLPEDVEIEGFRCVRVYVPDSNDYEQALHSLLTYPGNWFGWERDDLKQGKTAAQLWRNAYQLTASDFLAGKSCDECEDNGGDGIPGQVAPMGNGGLEESEDDDMAAVTWLEIEDGILYMYFGPCCKIAVGGDFGSIITPPPDGEDTDPADPPTWACNKANGIAQSIFDLAGDVVAAISGITTVYDSYAPAHAVLSPHNSVWLTTQAVCAAYFANKTEINTLVAEADTVDWLKCTWSPSLLETDNINEDEYWTLQTADYPVFTSAQRLFITRMIQAAGIQTVQWWARLFHDDASTCDCPEVDPYSGVVTFDDSRVIHLESQGSSLDVATLQNPHVMYFEVKGGLNENFQEVHWDEYLNASGTIQEIQVEWPLVSSDVPGYYPAESWDDTTPTLLANYLKAPVLNPAPDSVAYYPQPGKQVMVCTWVAPADLDSANLDFGIKLNPKDQDPNVQTYKFRAEITYAGALR